MFIFQCFVLQTVFLFIFEYGTDHLIFGGVLGWCGVESLAANDFIFNSF